MMAKGPCRRVVILKIGCDLIPGRDNVHPEKAYSENDHGTLCEMLTALLRKTRNHTVIITGIQSSFGHAHRGLRKEWRIPCDHIKAPTGNSRKKITLQIFDFKSAGNRVSLSTGDRL